MSEPTKDDALALLAEWFAWWEDSDEAPAKLPGALHVRTALLLNAEAEDAFYARHAERFIIPDPDPSGASERL